MVDEAFIGKYLQPGTKKTTLILFSDIRRNDFGFLDKINFQNRAKKSKILVRHEKFKIIQDYPNLGKARKSRRQGLGWRCFQVIMALFYYRITKPV